MNLDTLSDDGLLLVLGFLDTRSLLQCRGVCRRLRDAALHQHLWRKRRVTFGGRTEDRWVAAATLRVAPCLRALSLRRSGHLLGSLLAETSCAILELDVREELRPPVAVYVAEALARQAVLGRVKSVSLKLETSEGDTDFPMLIHQLLHTGGLTSIILNVYDPQGSLYYMRPATNRAVPASLQRLEYSWTYGHLSFLDTLLRWHAATLEVVHFPNGLGSYPGQSHGDRCAGTAALLGALPHLRELQCPILEGMPTLLQCPALKSLYLDLSCWLVLRWIAAEDLAGPFLLGVQQYLRQAVAGRLETLTLDFPEDVEESLMYRASKNATSLVLCLAGPGSGAPSALRSLRLAYYGKDASAQRPQPQLPLLASVLPRLQNLVSLDLGGPPTLAFLAAMDGRVLPRLKRLRVSLRCEGDKLCPHEWAHGTEPRGLLAKYPRLHLELKSSHDRKHRTCCEESDCHAFFRDPRGSVCTFYSHPDDLLCDQEHAENEMLIHL